MKTNSKASSLFLFLYHLQLITTQKIKFSYENLVKEALFKHKAHGTIINGKNALNNMALEYPDLNISVLKEFVTTDIVPLFKQKMFGFVKTVSPAPDTLAQLKGQIQIPPAWIAVEFLDKD